ncbi:AraC family transcriptional regulator [Dyadobacter fermentans]|uniref:Transcriptional regulator, AraC family n=1 Tax=Dyadobacter fermentans (strain ATCC 700827 / DSM 18053 / CIP 107007 / KCTC 52180 / NS114) TaxID=471854 RepID=C6VXI4_DYAFD|nr:AraC family transcriptional regulator [Dyadobacter fermentans]ACT93327.1 transcriptional regulator, AraC family [Dyadobacter fermentans DSM 18053]
MRKSRGFDGELIIEIPKVATSHCEQLPLISHLFISRMGYYPKALHHYYQRPNGISQAILLYCTDGQGWIELGGNQLHVRAGEVILLPTELPHAYGADTQNPWSIYWMHIAGDHSDAAVAAVMDRDGEPARAVHVGFSDERNALFTHIASTLLKGYSASNLLQANLALPHYLSSFIAPEHFGAQKPSAGAGSPTEKAILYMQENLSNSLSLDNIARSVNLSVSFFSRRFKKDTGYAPIEYFNYLRIQKACQLLHFSTWRINEVASAIGIDDPFYFSRLFKQQMGLSPAHYRKNKDIPRQ